VAREMNSKASIG